MLFDLPLEELQRYKPTRQEPPDFDEFWTSTLQQTAEHPLDAIVEDRDFGLKTVATYDVRFAGFGGTPVHAWLIVPRQLEGPLPCVIEFVGYGTGRGLPHTWLSWSAAGYAHLVMDNRGQTGGWWHGDTPDTGEHGEFAAVPGTLTRGISSPDTYYYRRLFADGVRAVELARSLEVVDATRLVAAGGSQGAATAIAVAALEPSIRYLVAHTPFLCDVRRAIDVTDAAPYSELLEFCAVNRGQAERAFATLAYFDGIHFAARASPSALFSVGLRDRVTPPSTVFAAFNHYAGPKRIDVWPYNEHEGGGVLQTQSAIDFLLNELA